ncbi:MAG: hypothetical protein F6K45_14945 [Kamptonema sp. SIO1D9]|nr:hypothetical protein [Kamptonema sp. SIO1D9]
MHLEFLVEEYSSQVFLELILPKILDRDITFNIHPFQGKPDLLKKLPARLKGYKAWITDEAQYMRLYVNILSV